MWMWVRVVLVRPWVFEVAVEVGGMAHVAVDEMTMMIRVWVEEA
jgi:hypothetical protein